VERLIKVNSNQLIGSGCYGDVYRISSRRVVKVYQDLEDAEEIRRDEILGSRLSEYCLPILEKVNVRVGEKSKQYLGVIKRYLPYKYCGNFCLCSHLSRFKRTQVLAGDAHFENIRCGKDGKPYLIDTQMFKWD
jgi:hypothetical protein